MTAATAPILGIHILSYGQAWSDVARLARLADDLGYDLVLGADHLFATGGDPFEPFFEGWLTLAAWGQLTSRARLGLLVGANPFRHPAIVAKMVATLDHQTGGRAILGMGAAWDREELDAHGIARGTTLGERLRTLDESLGIMRAILAGGTVTHAGPGYRLEGVRHEPRPVQAHVPVLVGASGERLGLRIVARHADLWQSWVPLGSTDEFRHKRDVLAEHCRTEERDPAAITALPAAKLILRDDAAAAELAFAVAAGERGWSDATFTEVRRTAWLTTPDEAAAALARYREAGAGGFIAQAFGPYDDETIHRLATEVWPAAG